VAARWRGGGDQGPGAGHDPAIPHKIVAEAKVAQGAGGSYAEAEGGEG